MARTDYTGVGQPVQQPVAPVTGRGPQVGSMGPGGVRTPRQTGFSQGEARGDRTGLDPMPLAAPPGPSAPPPQQFQVIQNPIMSGWSNLNPGAQGERLHQTGSIQTQGGPVVPPQGSAGLAQAREAERGFAGRTPAATGPAMSGTVSMAPRDQFGPVDSSLWRFSQGGRSF